MASHIPKKELSDICEELKEQTQLSPETRAKVENLITILKEVTKPEEERAADLEKLSTSLSTIYREVNNIVPALIINGFANLGLTMACFSALLDEIFNHSNPEQELAAGMKKLVSMLCSLENEKAANILSCFSEED